jgi:cardiolipin synthase
MERLHGESRPSITTTTAAAILAIIVAGVAGCATTGDLDPPVERTRPQPVIAANAAVTDRKANALLAEAVGESGATYKAKSRQLVDSVRESLSAPLVAGNKVVALVDGPATFAAIDAAMLGARSHIHIETYIFADDDLGQRFARRLVERRQQGIEVRVIYDAVGSIETPGAFFSELKNGGVEVIEFQPLNPVKTYFWRFHNRDHRKIIVVDGRVAFTGGLNISSAYSSASSSMPGPEAGLEEGWRDTHVQIAGPAVHQFQTLFLDMWSQLGGQLTQPNAHYYPKLSEQGPSLVSAVASSGLKEKDEAIYRTYLAAIRNSSQRIWITQAYFAPPAELRDALIHAAGRGVDVRIIVPGFTDSKLVLHAARREYEPLLKGRVRIVEAQNSLLHAKTALIDDAIAIIGSANLDYRSFLHNNEVTAVVVDDGIGKKMQAMFEGDLSTGKELTLAAWQKRSLLDRWKESIGGLFKFWL